MIIILTIIIPNLGLKELQDAALVIYAADKSTRLGPLGPFGGVSPTIATVDAQKDAFALALVGTNHQLKVDLRKGLEELLTLQAYDCSRIAGHDLNLFLQTGYKAKDVQGDPLGELPTPEDIVFRHYGKNMGELQPDWKPVPHAKNYTVQVVLNPDPAITDPANVIKEVIVDPSIAVIGGLPRGTKTWTRVKANGGGGNGHSEWSQPAERIVP